MRIGGAFPFGQLTVPVQLAAGGVFYMPPGNYYTLLGGQSVMQFMDSNDIVWRNVGSPGTLIGVVACDGSNYRIANLSGVVVGGLITNAGSGATNGIGLTATGVTISFGAAPTNGIAASAYPVVGGKLSGLTIAAAGSGFIFPPLISIDPPPVGGVTATATCTISGGVINSVTLQNPGAGYTAVPNVYITQQWNTYQGIGQPVNATVPTTAQPPGAIATQQPPFLPGINWPTASGGASITCNGLTGSGTLTGVGMASYGAGYTGATIPAVTITGCGAAAITPIMSMCVTSVTLGSGGSGYGAGAAPMWITSLGLVSGSDGDNGNYNPVDAQGVTTLTAGAVSAFTVESDGFGFQKVPVVAVLNTSAVATAQATGTAVCGGVADVSLISPAVED